MALSPESLSGKLLIAMPAMGDPRFERSVVYLCAHSEDGAMGLIVNKPVTELRFADLCKQLGIEYLSDDEIEDRIKRRKESEEREKLRKGLRDDLKGVLGDSLRKQFGPPKDPFRGSSYRPKSERTPPDGSGPLRRRDTRVHFGGPVEGGRGFVLHSSDYDSDGGTMQVDEEVSMTATLDVLRRIAAGEGPKSSMLALGYAGWGPGQLERELVQNAWLTGPARPDILWGRANEHKWNAALKVIGVDPQSLSSSAGHA